MVSLADQIELESAERTPVMHGILENLAYLVHNSNVSCLTPEDDWKKAIILLRCDVLRVSWSSLDGLRENTLENYLQREIKFKALENYELGIGDSENNWHEAVSSYSKLIFDAFSYSISGRRAA